MKISYNWLKDYINIDLDPKQVATYLTDIGLEVEGIEEVESIKGGLKGVIIGEVKTKSKHPNADRLNLTTVDIGKENLLHIVCGAPNVQVGQKVPVATIGTTLFIDEKPLKIKKGKIRGEVSEGMICAEDELGLGSSHEGIMVLDSNAENGQLASDYFKIETDVVFEIGLTPNRSDAMSHIGVARDLATVLKHNNIDCQVKFPDINTFKEGNEKGMSIHIEDINACPRYAGVCIENVTIQESPKWLKKKLQSIGLTPINNVVDITNYVLHETGQPLHAFDSSKIKNKTVKVQQLKDKTAFVTLDDQKRELSDQDLMICNGENDPMCIAGVFGGSKSGVTTYTKNIFLESAYFNPVSVRKTAKRHALSTDASFRFERGVDPNLVIYALKRASLMIEEYCNGTISSKITDIYPNKIEHKAVKISYQKIDSIIGQKIDREVMASILRNLDIEITSSDDTSLLLSVPPYRIDVTRDVDVIEEILRIYGYNAIRMPKNLTSSISYSEKNSPFKLENIIADMLSSNGFSECKNNSLTKGEFVELIKELEVSENVNLLNPLSQDLNALRQTLLFSGLENLAYNVNRKQTNLSFYEFGKTYRLTDEKFFEKNNLAIYACGNTTSEIWENSNKQKDFYWLKTQVEVVLNRLGITNYKGKSVDLSYLSDAFCFILKKQPLVHFGEVNQSILEKIGIKIPVYYAQFDWDLLVKLARSNKTKAQETNKFPTVRRDLALLLDNDVAFSSLKTIAHQTENTLLKSVNLFDEYSGKNLPTGKKSYALSFSLESIEKTLTDKEIDKVMKKLIKAFELKVGAEVRM
ncbi:MAG: phenylalanine--tRNA ligase subunit beta [Flavobacteriales bacterium]